VYRQELNFAAVKTALISRERIHKRRRSPLARARAGGVDVKLDPGGIRDIEFLVQCLQRTYGGSEPWLRSGGTLFSLQKLHDKSHITGNEFHELTATYEFLRHLEHRLQWRWGRQTHTLPTGPAEVSVLHRSMINLVSGQEHFDDLPATVRRRMAQVAEIYERVVYQQQSRQERERAGEGFQLRRCEAGSAGQTNQQILERLAYDAPALYAIASRDDLSPQARRGLFRFLGSAFTSSERYAQVLREAPAVSHAVKIFAASDYLTEILVRHPEEIASLARLESRGELPQTNSLFDRSSHREIQSSDPILEYLAASSASYGDQLASLRQHYRHRVFCSGARDLTGVSDIYESLAVTTAAAEDAIAAAVRIAGQPPALAVMGLGRLGSGEFDLLSDADLLFVCQENSDRWTLSKSAELIIQTLSAYTRHGMVFPVDTRLRPRGGEGELLVTPSQLEAYFLQEAQPWEALSYSKLRWIAGSQPVAGQALSVTQTLFRRFASDAGFARAVRGMRARLEEAERGDPSFKGSPGGVYDIDFVVSYLLVKHTIEITNGSLRERIWRCVEKGILKREDAVVLDRGAALFRSVEHYVRLVTGRRRKWLPGSGVGRSTIEEFLARVLGETFSGRLESHLQDTLQQVRQVYDRVLT
jgi:glutamate-ammonia-ligase adenylyltransferase